MPFETYFQQVQATITKEINLPFDAPFTDKWIDKYNDEFERLYNEGLTPEQAVRIHFADIDSKALKLKRVKTTKK